MFLLILGVIVTVAGFAIGSYCGNNGYSKKPRLLALLGIVPIVLSCVTSVPAGYTGIVTTFGHVEEYMFEAGFHVKSPIQSIVTMDNRTQKVNRTDECFSSDIQQVNATYSINYNIDKSTAMTLYKNIGVDYFETVVVPCALEDLKAVFSKYTADKLVSERESLSVLVEDMLKEDMRPYGINIVNVNVENIDFTDAYTSAVESKQVAAQNKLKAETEQSQETMVRQAEASRTVIAANADAEKVKIDAEANAAVKKVQADADLYAAQKAAEASKYKMEKEAEGNAKLTQSLTAELVSYLYAQRWNGQLPTTMFGESSVVPMMDIGK